MWLKFTPQPLCISEPGFKELVVGDDLRAGCTERVHNSVTTQVTWRRDAPLCAPGVCERAAPAISTAAVTAKMLLARVLIVTSSGSGTRRPSPEGLGYRCRSFMRKPPEPNARSPESLPQPRDRILPGTDVTNP
jgi:hypothetical protein